MSAKKVETLSANSAASFFAGIGGFELALERAGYKVGMQSEILPFCRSVLQKRFPKADLLGDILTINPQDIPEATIWTAGFPCQDLSLARGMLGREGLKGRRSGLFFEISRLAKAKKPKYIVFENVQGLVTSHRGKDLFEIISEMTSIGYAIAWRILNSRYFGSPQSRPRIYLVAIRDGTIEQALGTLLESGEHPKVDSPRIGFITSSQKSVDGAVVPKVSYCLAATSGRHTGTDWSRTYVAYKAAVRRLTPRECESLQGFPSEWTDIGESWGESDRYHAIGNAVTVNVSEWVIQRIGGQWEAPLSELTRNFSVIVSKNPDLGKLEEIKWSHCGVSNGKQTWQIDAPSHPIQPIFRELGEIIEPKPRAKHYYLSDNAAKGIIRRVDTQNRTLFSPLDKALRRMAKQ